ncbi:MAG: hypothetical protein JTJ12_06685 [Eubacterium sp.]|nr:hypothetical protein [Eubacterium sp.]
MDKKELFRAIDACEDCFIREAAEDIQKRKPSMIRRFFFVNSSESPEKDMRELSVIRVAAAIVICVIVLSIGVQTAARVSTVFRDWIEQTFQIKSSSDNQKGKNGRSNEEETGRVRRRNNKADEGQDSVSQIEKVPMKDNLQIVGTNESFIYESKTDANSDEIVEKVYSIKDGKLSKLLMQSFSGSYKASTFSFQYSIIGQEIFGYNYSENLVQVFDQMNKKGKIYLSIENAKGDEQILCVNLKSGECRQVVKSGDGMNMSMSPDGKYILINHSKSYWTVFDTEKETERKLEGLSGYALSNEYDFINGNHVSTVGNAFTKNNTEFYRLNYIDLKTGKVKVYPEYGDIKGCWTYQCDTKKKQLEIENLITKQKKVIPLKQAEDVHIMQINGDYVLLGTDFDAVYYLYNLQDETYRELDIPEEIRGTLEMYIAKKEKKLLLTNEKEAYLVNLK